MSAARNSRRARSSTISTRRPIRRVSAWVSANAGSGKTHVLAQRVIRLLLRGTDPAKILCITFTKAAAANMANRVFDTLAEWTALDDAALDDADRGSHRRARPTRRQRARARRLFAAALETPGGLKVQTIHAFCTRLLHQFPFEADVAARFEVLDEATEPRSCSSSSRSTCCSKAPPSRTVPLGKALADRDHRRGRLRPSSEVIARRSASATRSAAWINRAGGARQRDRTNCRRRFGIAPDDTLEAVEAEFFVGCAHSARRMAGADRDLLAQGQQERQEQAQRLQPHAQRTGRERLDSYLRDLLHRRAIDAAQTASSPRRSAKRIPHWLERLLRRTGARLRAARARRALHARDRTAALLTHRRRGDRRATGPKRTGAACSTTTT